jgi:hypothetical protein
MSNFHQIGRPDPKVAQLLNIGTIPPLATTRWLPRHKAQVVDAVRAGLLSVDQACDLYDLTLEEFIGWQRTLQQLGVDGLRVSRPRPQLLPEQPSVHRRTLFTLSYPVHGHA